jgi:DNA-directed RNA polymerase specialized sigma24 family protein
MILEKIEPISTALIQEKGIESVVDWFDQYKEYFYTLGWCYLPNQHQIEELFYRSILQVHKELPRYKGNQSFKMWMTSILIQNSRVLARDGSSEDMEQREGIFNALDQLAGDEKEALILTYVMGFSREEAEQILGISADKIKDLLYSGIKSIRNQLYASHFNGCQEFQRNYIDYLEKSMNRPEKIEFEMHLYNCRECQEDLASFQEVAMTRLDFAEGELGLNVPPSLMENVRKRLMDKKEHQQQKKKKRNKRALIIASAFAFVLALGFITGAFPKVYYAWTEDDVHLRAFLQEGFGQRLNLEAESEGVLVKIKGVVADDYQTLVFYEIHDMNEDKRYIMNFEDGVFVENQNDIMKRDSYPRYSIPDVEAEMNKNQKNVFYGKVALWPLDENQGVIKLRITKLQELAEGTEMAYGFWGDSYKTGKWTFEIPATKQPSTEYTLNEQKEIEGIPIRFEKLTIAPTSTLLQYAINVEKPEKRIEFTNFKTLRVNKKRLKADRFGSLFMDHQEDSDWTALQMHFGPLYGEKPNEVSAELDSVYFSVADPRSIDMGESQTFPQTIEYAGSKISIDKVESRQSTEVTISDNNLENRVYESLQVNFIDGSNNEPSNMHMDSKGVVIDKHGVEYDVNTDIVDYEKIEQPRYFVTEQSMKIEGLDPTAMKLEIRGYNSIKYINEAWDLGTVLLSKEE